MTSTTQQKKKADAPVDEKKEKMKNALFSGISSKKEDSDSDEKEEKKEPEPAAPVGEMDLLSLDTTPASQPAASTGGNLLDMGGDSNNLLDQPSQPGNLLDSAGSQPAQMDVNQ